ncbi:MAG: aminotransferase class I/II-fold pyridoxal phosphate-dependent enzyme [Candidatus Nanopelagicales bacterium]
MSDRIGPAPFDDVALDELRRRTSAKWRMHPADVLPTFVAEMDFPLAEPIAAALADAVARGDTGYAWPQRLPEVFAADAARRFGWTVHPARVSVYGDVLTAVSWALRALTRPGDGVVITPPVYPPFFSVVPDVAGRRLVEVPLARDGAGWTWDLDALAAAFAREDVRAFLLCNPHNPTGQVADRALLTEIAGLATRHGVVVVADEVHAPMTLPGAVHTPYVSLGEEAAGDSVTVTSASKAWNVPGLKCAQLVAGSASLADRLGERVPQEAHFTTGLFGVVAAVAAYSEGQDWLDRALATIDRNRALLADLLDRDLPGTRYVAPAAGYLAWVDCSELGLGPDPAAVFLERGRVACGSGPAFGAGGAGHVRLSIATSAGILTEIVQRMAAALR